GTQYGGGARMAPGAYIDDGLLDFFTVQKSSRIIELDCGGGAWYHLDGEDFFAGDGKIRISIMPSALKVIAPKPCNV
ncbi:MAG: hypothetical protein COT18_08390, partial [Elusimicrobia bacterium CG08_land_8_20_14_0_20_59_10]